MAYRWKAALKGRASDFKTIQGELRVSDFWLQEKDSTFYLVGDRFDKMNSHQEVYEAAKELIADINLCFQFARPEFIAIGLGDHIEERRFDGSSVTHRHLYARTGLFTSGGGVSKLIVSPAVAPPPPPQPSFPENVIKAFGINDNFREAVKAFNAEPKNWKDLYIACETVRKSNSPTKDYNDLVAFGWANETELKRFFRTAGYHRHGLPRDPIKGVTPLPLDDAVELVQRLLAEWAKKLSR